MKRRLLGSLVLGMVAILGMVSCVPGRWTPAESSRPGLGYGYGDASEGWVMAPYLEEPSFGLFLYKEPDSTLVRFAMCRSHNKEGEPEWQLVDEMWVSLRGDSAWLGGGRCACYAGQTVDPELFGLFRGVKSADMQPVRLWRASRRGKHIEEVDPHGVHCACRSVD